MVALRVVVIHPVCKPVLYLRKGLVLRDQAGDLVLHVAEEALLGRVVPAVALPGHGLHERRVLELCDEGPTGVVAALVTVHDGHVVQRRAVQGQQRVHRVQHELDLQGFAHLPGQDLMRHGVEDRGEVAAPARVKQVSDVGQQDLPRPARGEVPVGHVRRNGARFQGSGQLLVGIWLPERAFQAVFLHETPDFLEIHALSGVEQPHVDASGPLRVAILERFQNFVEVRRVLILPDLTVRRGVQPGVIAGPGHARQSAEVRDVQQVVVPADGLPDEPVLYFGGCFDSHCFRASVFAICSFFKNSTS